MASYGSQAVLQELIIPHPFAAGVAPMNLVQAALAPQPCALGMLGLSRASPP